MKFLKFFFCFIGLVPILGCATRAVQSETLLASSHNQLRSVVQIANIDFFDQSAGYCGPATLAMAMKWAGRNLSVDEVAKQVYTPGLNGTLQSDLVIASRRQGLTSIEIHGLSALLTEIAAGHPVIIFENLSFSWMPQWHYALVIGYDLDSEEIILHSGHKPFFRWDLKKFERSWMLADYWGLVILPAGELSETASEHAHITAAIALEQMNQTIGAEKSYRKILQKWPDSFMALVGLANVVFLRGDRKAAISLLRKALKHHPDSKQVLHNLMVANQFK